MFRLFSTLFVVSILASCVKLQINPGNVVGDTVDAGKEAYETIKRNRNGEEERLYSHSIIFVESKTPAANVAHCKKEITGIISESGYSLKSILSESSKVVESDSGTAVECELRAVVKSTA